MLLKYQKAYQRFVKEELETLIPELKEDVEGEQIVERKDSYDIRRVERMDANIEREIRMVFERVQTRLMRLFPDSTLRKWAQAMVGRVNKVTKNNVVKVAAAVDLKVEPLLKDDHLNPYFTNVIDENVGLIRSIADERMPAFKNRLVGMITKDQNVRTIAEAIQKNFRTTKTKARLLARDQIGKLNGELNQHRQESIGGKRYRWRTARDLRVRGNPSGLYPNAKHDHWKREGKIFSWANPPAGGHPGQDFECRCYAEMVMEDVLD